LTGRMQKKFMQMCTGNDYRRQPDLAEIRTEKNLSERKGEYERL